MDELGAILETCSRLGGANQNAVLATVVHVTGSAYRRPGARMLVLPDGRRVGSVSGGCLEGEITKKAWWFTESGAPVIRVYDTTSNDDAVWEFGLGCNGVVHVMLERVNTPASSELIEFLKTQRSQREPAVVATVIRAGTRCSSRLGDRLLLGQDGVRGGSLAGSAMELEILASACEVGCQQKSRLIHLDDADVFLEWVGPRLPLLVFGAGHDTVPFVAIARQMGWSVTIVDCRPAYAKPERFPDADLVALMHIADPLRELEIGPGTAVVLMTHSYPLDLILLPRLLELQPFYLGILGPSTRAGRLFGDLGIRRPSYVHAPVGLDIGGDNPAAVGLAIAAEIQAAVHSRSGGMLKHRKSAIHAPCTEVGSSAFARHDSTRPAFCENTVSVGF
jgi:xanthine dehydrogenase accessory factor